MGGDHVYMYRGFSQDIGHYQEGSREGSKVNFIAFSPQRMSHNDWLRLSFFRRSIGFGYDTTPELIAPARTVAEYIARNARNIHQGIRWDGVSYRQGKNVRHLDVSRHEQPGAFERNLGRIEIGQGKEPHPRYPLSLVLTTLADLVPDARMQLLELPKPVFVVFERSE